MWSTGAGQPNITVDKTGYYTLTVQDVNGCTGSDTIQIVHKDCLNGVNIPTAFTPNNDGKNDIFRAKAFGDVVSFQLIIYNRLGQTVFVTTDRFAGWDGTLNGLPQNPDTFIYKCVYQLQGRKQVMEKGTVVLIR